MEELKVESVGLDPFYPLCPTGVPYLLEQFLLLLTDPLDCASLF